MPSPATVSREFIFIRHGESESNADLATLHPQTINLTPKGIQQALDKALGWHEAPDVFITSKYVRTQQTALPFKQKFPHVPDEQWDIHEFTYLDPVRYRNTTFSQRLPHSQAYWDKADPHHKDAAAAESFAEFMHRCHATIDRMKKSTYAHSVAFCHGYFMKGLVLALDGHFDTVDGSAMAKFQSFHKEMPLDNCGVVRFTVEGETVRYRLETQDTTHPRGQLRTD